MEWHSPQVINESGVNLCKEGTRSVRDGVTDSLFEFIEGENREMKGRAVVHEDMIVVSKGGLTRMQ